MTSIYAMLNQSCRQLVSSINGLIERVSAGCDNRAFLDGVQTCMTDLGGLVRCVQAYETPATAEKKMVLARTLDVKNAVVATVSTMKGFHTESHGSRLQPHQLQQVKVTKQNLSQVVGRLGKSVQILTRAEKAIEPSPTPQRAPPPNTSPLRTSNPTHRSSTPPPAQASPEVVKKRVPMNVTAMRGFALPGLAKPPDLRRSSESDDSATRGSPSPFPAAPIEEYPVETVEEPADENPPPHEFESNFDYNSNDPSQDSGYTDTYDPYATPVDTNSPSYPVDDHSYSYPDTTPASAPAAGFESHDYDSNSALAANLPSSAPPADFTPTPSTSSPLHSCAEACLGSIADMEAAMVSKEREPFTASIKSAISGMEQLVSEMVIDTEEEQMEIRQNLVSFISHSKMHFLNPHDKYTHNQYQLYKNKVVATITMHLSEDVQAQVYTSRGLDRQELSEKDQEQSAPAASAPVQIPAINSRTPSATHPTSEMGSPTDRSGFVQAKSPRWTSSNRDTFSGEGFGSRTYGGGTADSYGSSFGAGSRASFLSRARRDGQLDSTLEDLNSLVDDIADSSTPGRGTMRATARHQPGPGVSPPSRSRTNLKTSGSNSVPDLAALWTKPENEPATMDAAGAELLLIKSVTEIVKRLCPSDWSHLHPDEVGKFELSLLGSIRTFEKYTSTSQPQPVSVSPSMSSPSPTRNNLQSSSPGLRRTTSSKADTSSVRRKATKLKLNPLKIKRGGRKTEGPSFRLGQFSASDPPLARTAKTITELGFKCTISLKTIVKTFTDTQPAYLNSVPPPNDVEIPAKNQFVQVSTQLRKVLLDCFESLMAQSSDNSDSMSRTRDRIREQLQERTMAPRPRDEKSLKRGQYMRFSVVSLLEILVLSSERLVYLASQLATLLPAFDFTETSYCYFTISTAAALAEVLDVTTEHILTLFDLLQYQNDNIHLLWQPETRPPLPASESVWKVKKEMFETGNREDMFSAGTLSSLIVRLTSANFDQPLLHAFVVGFPQFSSSGEVFDRLMERYHVPSNVDESQQSQFIKMRVANILLQWMKMKFHSIDIQVLGEIQAYAEGTLKEDKFNDLSSYILKELGDRSRFQSTVVSQKRIPDTIVHFELGPYPAYAMWLQHDRHDISEQFTLIEMEMYQRILKSELINQKWSKEKTATLANNVVRLLTRINEVSFHVATLLLMQKKLKDRVKMLSKVIGVAKTLRDMNNFNSLMGIMTGLVLSPVSRLKHTWAKLPDKSRQMFNELEVVQDPSSSFKNMREALLNAGDSTLPYLGVHLSDLTFMEEGNPDWIEGAGGMKLINFPKHHLVTRSIDSCLAHQGVNFGLTPKEPLYTFLVELPAMREKELYDLSLEREPRNSLIKDVS